MLTFNKALSLEKALLRQKSFITELDIISQEFEEIPNDSKQLYI